eukprot:m.108717 g.108717  ORF g.108717 m.108717 type:complete len:56 (-) comp10668_c1_seq2:1368-1535(-)
MTGVLGRHYLCSSSFIFLSQQHSPPHLQNQLYRRRLDDKNAVLRPWTVQPDTTLP